MSVQHVRSAATAARTLARIGGAPECLPRPCGSRLAAARRRAHPVGPRARERRAGRAQHGGRSARRRRGRRRAHRAAAARVPAPAQARGRRHHRERPTRAPDGGRARPGESARRAGGAIRSGHDGRAPADERRGARPPARAPALRGAEGLRSGRATAPPRGTSSRLCARESSSRTASPRPRRHASSSACAPPAGSS